MPPSNEMFDKESLFLTESDLTMLNLDRLIKEMVEAQETIRNIKQRDTERFQEFDRKLNEAMNQIAAIIRTLSEMREICAGGRPV
jgi:hypothetical protein